MGDLSMSLFAFVPELRARGFNAQLAGWHDHKVYTEYWPRSDSVGIWVIGPHQGVRLVWNSKELTFPPPTFAAGLFQSNVRRTRPSNEEKDI